MNSLFQEDGMHLPVLL